MHTDPAQAVTLPKCYPQLLQPQSLKSGEHTKCNNNNICVICLNHDCLARMLRSKLGMYKYAAIIFLVIAVVQSIKTNFMSAEDIRSICDNNQICVNIWAIISARNWKYSILLSLCLRKLRQFDGTVFFCFDSSTGVEYPLKKSTLFLLIGS